MSTAPPAAASLHRFLSPASSNLLPLPLLARLADDGCCARCVLRLGGLRDVATFARPGAELEAALVAAFAGADLTASPLDGESKSDPPSSSSSADADASSASEASSAVAASAPASASAIDAPTAMDTSATTAGTVFTHAAPCVGCLGVLEDATFEAAAQRVRRDLDSGGYACSDYSLVASVLPSVLLRQFAALESGDRASVKRWNDWLLANRETAELYLEDSQQGGALLRLMISLEMPTALDWPKGEPIALMTAFAMAGSNWQTDVRSLAHGVLWSWLENQVGAATKLVPLGQTDAQRLLGRLLPGLPSIVDAASELKDDELGAGLPGLAFASARHEHQYTRLFRS